MLARRSVLRLVGVALVATIMAFTLGLSTVGAQTQLQWPKATRPVVTGTDYMVTAGSPLAAMAGMKVLMEGGNAIDAGVAVAAALNVVDPWLSGLGGDHAIIIYSAEAQKVTCILGLGWAGQNATFDFYLNEVGEIPSNGPLSAHVPGSFAAWVMALDRYGTKTLAEVFAPAIDLAENGFPITKMVGDSLQSRSTVELMSRYPETSAIWWRDGKPLGHGDVVIQKDLAGTFRKLAAAELANLSKGRSAALRAAHDLYYKGEIAQAIVDHLKSYGGILEYEDFAEFEAVEVPPIMTTYRGYEVYETPEPTQGHVLLQALNILEGYDLKSMSNTDPEYIHIVAEALKLALADREAFVADPRFVDVPMEGLLSKEYAAEQRARIKSDSVLTWPIEPGNPYKYMDSAISAEPQQAPYEFVSPNGAVLTWVEGCTQHFAVVDKDRNVFATTGSILGSWGSGMVVPGYGFLLNNRMGYYHLIEGHPNELMPRKRTRQTIQSAIVMKDGKPFMTLGTPGADRQVQGMLQVFLNYVEFGMTVQESIERARNTGTTMHPGSSFPYRVGGQLEVEGFFVSEEAIEALKAKGHDVRVYSPLTIGGNLQAIVIDDPPGALLGGADPRREGYVIGW